MKRSAVGMSWDGANTFPSRGGQRGRGGGGMRGRGASTGGRGRGAGGRGRGVGGRGGAGGRGRGRGAPKPNIPQAPPGMERPPLNTEDVTIGSFYVDPKTLSTNRMIMTQTCAAPRDVNLFAEEQARFQYFRAVKNFNFAKKFAKKAGPECRVGRQFNCNACDIFFYTKQEIDEHRATNAHADLMLIYNHMRKIADQWYAKQKNPDYELPGWVTQAEIDGLAIGETTGKAGQTIPELSGGGSSTPLTDDIFSGIDTTISEDDFILATYDNIMEIHWPKASTNHFCRCCNYLSFDTEEELQTHLGSEKHKESESSYETAWCVSCQRHTGSKEQLEVHNGTARHKMIKQLLADTRLRAIRFWKRAQSKNIAKTETDDSVVAVGGFKCKICNIDLSSAEDVKKHKLSKEHLENTTKGKGLAGTSKAKESGESRRSLLSQDFLSWRPKEKQPRPSGPAATPTSQSLHWRDREQNTRGYSSYVQPREDYYYTEQYDNYSSFEDYNGSPSAAYYGRQMPPSRSYGGGGYSYGYAMQSPSSMSRMLPPQAFRRGRGRGGGY